MRASLVIILAVACHGSSKDDARVDDSGTNEAWSITLSQGSLAPAFDPTVLHYTVEEAALVASTTVLDSDTQATLEHKTIDGVLLASGEGSFEVPLQAGERVDVTVDGVTYQVTVRPDALGDMVTEGRASDGFILLAPYGFPAPVAGIVPALVIVDELGVVVWYRLLEVPALDFHAAEGGGLTYLSSVKATGWEGVVLGPGYETESVVRSLPGAGGEPIGTDVHAFEHRPDGTAILFGKTLRFVDMQKWGADEGCCMVTDYVIQHIRPPDEVLFEWNTKDWLGFENLPAAFFDELHDGWEYTHLNSVDVDVDGTWLVSVRWMSQVVRIAPVDMTWNGTAYTAGTILERIGGVDDSDFLFVDDPRGSGWEGFATQHSARAVGTDGVLVYDNAIHPDLGTVGDSRAAEYVLDRKTHTARLVWEHSAGIGLGATEANGSVERLTDGGTLIGWGALYDRAPGTASLTEVDASGTVRFTLTLPDGMITYRAAKAMWTDGTWKAP